MMTMITEYHENNMKSHNKPMLGYYYYSINWNQF